MTGSISSLRSRAARLAGVLVLLMGLAIALAPSIAAAAGAYAEYHDLTSAEHSARVASLTADGYRPIALSISGDPASPRHAGAWVQRSGPAFTVFQDQTFAGYQTILQSLASGGFQPTIISATGPDDGSVLFAGVLEETFNVYVTLEGVDTGTMYATTGNFSQVNARLRSVAVYGTPGAAPKYAGIWDLNTENIGQDWTFDLSERDQKLQTKPHLQEGARPSLVVRSADGNYSTTWEDTRLAGGWKAYADLTKAKYESKITSLGKSGWQVIRVAARGTGDATLYDVIFAETDVPEAHEWHATGTTDPALAGFDAWVEARMQQSGVRAGELAIVRNGRLVYARGFTLAEAGYPITEPTDLFRIGSTTKPLTSIVINRLTEDTGPNAIHLTDTMQSILGIVPPGGGAVADSRWNDITISELLSHSGGWDRSTAGDLIFLDAVAAADLGVKLPISKSELASWMADQTLQFDPGTRVAYSNVGFFLAGRIAEKVTGDTYLQNVKDLIFKPLGLKRPKFAKATGPSGKEVPASPYVPSVAPTVLNPSGKLVPVFKGTYNLINADSAGAFVMAAPDYAKILAAFDQPTNPLLTQASIDQMWTAPLASAPTDLRGWIAASVPDAQGNPVNAYHHDGIIPGGSAVIFHRADGISLVLFFNRDVLGGLHGEIEGAQLSAIANQVVTWPSGDLFPTFGIPSF